MTDYIMPKWTKADGPARWCYQHKQPGSRWLGGARWNSSNGIIHPNDIMPVADMNATQLRYELEDVTARPGGNADVARRLLKLYGDNLKRYEITTFLNSIRPLYPEVVCPWDPPQQTIYYFIFRDDWRMSTEAIEAHKETYRKNKR